VFQKLIRLCTVIIVVICFVSTGCSRSLKIRGTSENLLDQAHAVHPISAKDASISVKVKKWVWGPYNYKEDMVTALSQRGYPVVDVDPTYQIEGSCVIGLGRYMMPKILWAVVMGIPSLVLPVPIMSGGTIKLDFTIANGATGTVLSQTKKTLDSHITGFSLWGLVGWAVKYSHDDLYSVASMLIDEELKAENQSCALAYEEAVGLDTSVSYRAFLDSPHAVGVQRTRAQMRLDEIMTAEIAQAFEKASKSDTIESYKQFTNDHPSHENVNRARKKIAEIRRSESNKNTNIDDLPEDRPKPKRAKTNLIDD